MCRLNVANLSLSFPRTQLRILLLPRAGSDEYEQCSVHIDSMQIITFMFGEVCFISDI